jgi:tRNA modification GTPase
MILGEITGTVTSDDLLGKIFSSFCIGKWSGTERINKN